MPAFSTQPVMVSRSESVKREPASHRLGREQVEHSARLGPPAGEVEQLAHHGQQRVGLGQRPVGQPDPELVAGVAVRCRPIPKAAEISGA